ncbi:MAG: ATP-binding protein [Armatimonadota bacterium]|nr:ATP-binding protein [Armatimonadota bacterium]
MDSETLLDLLEEVRSHGSELQDVELKKAKDGMPTESVLESLSAFANRRGGGVLIFGIDEVAGYVATGVYDAGSLQEELSGLANDQMEPRIQPEFTLAEADGEVIVAAEVRELPDARKPCYIRRRGLPNGAYRRVGNTNRRMTADDLAQFLGALRDDFEAGPVNDATIEEYRGAIARRDPSSGAGEASDTDLLRRGGFVAEQKQRLIPTVAGLLLFGDDPQRFFPRCVATVTQFEGTTVAAREAGSRYLFDREIHGRAQDIIVRAVETVMGRVARRAEVRGLWRAEVPEYPEEVIREAITNAVAHRSYAHRGTAIRIRIFADRIEIRNPGTLFGTVTLDNIEHEQSTRNPRMVAALREFGLMEQRGTGVTLMIAEMKRAGLAPPDFHESSTSFQVTLRNAHLMSPEVREWLQQFGPHSLSEQQLMALAYLRLHGRMANRDFQRINSVGGPTATRELRGLVDVGIIEMHGTRGGAYYTLAPTQAPRDVMLSFDEEHEEEARIVEVLSQIQPAGRAEIAALLYRRRDLSQAELRHVSYLLGKLVDMGVLAPAGERRGRVYTIRSVSNGVGD